LIFFIQAHLRGLQERVVQSTRELENSVSGRISTNSSRGSSPLLYNGGSFEDIGIGGAGLEIEEVSKLEKKLKILEKAETMAVNKVKSMDAEILNLKSEIKCLLEDKSSLSSQLEEVGRAGAQTQLIISSLKKDKMNLEKQLKELRGYNFEDLQVSFYIFSGFEYNFFFQKHFIKIYFFHLYKNWIQTVISNFTQSFCPFV